MPRAASRKLAAARSELEERRIALQKTAVDRIHRLALVKNFMHTQSASKRRHCRRYWPRQDTSVSHVV